MKANIKFGILGFTLALFLSTTAMAQMSTNNQDAPIAASNFDFSVGTSTVLNYTATLVENEVFVKLLVKGESECIYALERSVDGSDFTAISFKRGFPTPDQNTELMYCFIDKNPSDKTSYYRIKEIRPSDEIYSNAVVICKKAEMAYTEE